MKKKLTLFCSILILFSGSLIAQRSVKIKLYAYAQPVHSGIQSKTQIAESGIEYKSESKSKLNYIIYLEHRSSKTIRPLEIWIAGKAYGIKMNQIEFTPVELTDNSNIKDPKKILLVPATSNKVFSISLTGLSEIANSKSDELKNQKANEITLVYRRKCKSLYTISSLIIPLPSIPMM